MKKLYAACTNVKRVLYVMLVSVIVVIPALVYTLKLLWERTRDGKSGFSIAELKEVRKSKQELQTEEDNKADNLDVFLAQKTAEIEELTKATTATTALLKDKLTQAQAGIDADAISAAFKQIITQSLSRPYHARVSSMLSMQANEDRLQEQVELVTPDGSVVVVGFEDPETKRSQVVVVLMDVLDRNRKNSGRVVYMGPAWPAVMCLGKVDKPTKDKSKSKCGVVGQIPSEMLSLVGVDIDSPILEELQAEGESPFTRRFLAALNATGNDYPDGGWDPGHNYDDGS